MFAHNINNAILSTPDSRGLAIIIDFSDSRNLYSNCWNHLFVIRRLCMFKDLNFSMYRQFSVNKLELDRIVFAASHYLNLPTPSNYPILFVVNGSVSRDDVNTLVTGHDEIDIGKDILEPLLSSEHLADNPKIIIINYNNTHASNVSLDLLQIPHGQNFIVALTNTDHEINGHIEDIFVEWRIHCSKLIDFEERILRLESQKFKRMIVKSHLKQPVYLYRHSSKVINYEVAKINVCV